MIQKLSSKIAILTLTTAFMAIACSNPDLTGTRIAYVHEINDEVTLRTYDLADNPAHTDGPWQSLLTLNDGKGAWYYRYPSLSPDGTKVAVFTNAYNEGDGPGIYAVDIRKGEMELIYNDMEAEYPSWSPDGTKIAFSARGNIFVMDEDGTNIKRLTYDGRPNKVEPSSFAYDPSWSPDGSKIVFTVSNRDFRLYGQPDCDKDGMDRIDWYANSYFGEEIHTINSDGTNRQKIFDVRVNEIDNKDARLWEPSWSRDGSKIAFIGALISKDQTSAESQQRYRDRLNGRGLVQLSGADVFSIGINGENLIQITKSGFIWGFSFSPDGSHMAVVEGMLSHRNAMILQSNGEPSNLKHYRSGYPIDVFAFSTEKLQEGMEDKPEFQYLFELENTCLRREISWSP